MVQTITSTLPADLKEWLIKENDQLGFDYFGQCITAILQHSDFATRWDFEGADLDKLASLIQWRSQTVSKYRVKELC